MDREFLEGLGLDKAKVDQVMAEHGKALTAEKAKVTATEAKLTAANNTIEGLQENVKKFDGVDIEKLKTDAKEWETKYNNDIKAEQAKAENIRKEYALKDALKSKGVTDPEYLIFKHGGIEKFAFDDKGQAIGLDDTLKTYKESTPTIFAETNNAAANNSGSGFRVDTGAANDNSGTGDGDVNKAFNDAIRGAFKN